MITQFQAGREEKKRTLHKVRKLFINKKAEDDDPENVDPASRLLNQNVTYMVKSDLCIVEVNRRIVVDMHLLNSNFDVSNAIIEDRYPQKSVILKLKVNENNSPVPWEYSVKRLESYGDLNMAVWARKLKDYHKHYMNLMAKYFAVFNSEDPLIQQEIEEVKIKACGAHQEIEAKYPYLKWVIFAGAESVDMVCSAYSEDFLKEFGHSVESFQTWVASNGIPSTLDGNSEVHHKIIQSFLDRLSVEKGAVYFGNEYPTFMVDAHGHKKDIIAQYVNVTDPTPDGLLLSGYIILKQTPSSLKKACQQDLLTRKKVKDMGDNDFQDTENARTLEDKMAMLEEIS